MKTFLLSAIGIIPAIPALFCLMAGFQSTEAGAQKAEQTAEQKAKPKLPKLDEPESGDSKGSKDGASDAVRKALEEAKKLAGRPERSDLIQRFPKKNPLLGIWTVSKAFRNRANAKTLTTGYVFFGKSYCSLNIFQESAFTKHKAFQSGVRSYRVEGGFLVMSSLVGVRSGNTREELLVEGRGFQERRRFLLQSPKLLRIYQGPNSFLELIKIEDFD